MGAGQAAPEKLEAGAVPLFSSNAEAAARNAEAPARPGGVLPDFVHQPAIAGGWEAPATVLFPVMVIVLLLRAAACSDVRHDRRDTTHARPNAGSRPEAFDYAIFAAIAAAVCIAPFLFYPFLVMQVLVFALFAMAFNLLLGFGGN